MTRTNSTREPLVSVVTPVYNGERYLRECVESVLAQTYQRWDLTIVNNCSTDQTLDIANEYAARDPRIRVHNNVSFVPVIENHNIAFRLVSPDSLYCKPLAADDMLLPECLERMVGLAEEYPNVGIVGAYGIFSRPEMGVYCRGVQYPRAVLPGRDLCRKYLLGEGPAVFGAPTLVLFRSEIVRRRFAFYNEGNIHADSEACLESLDDCDFGFVHQILTFMRVQDESLSTFSQRLNTYVPYRLYVLTKYGPKYLTREELAPKVKKLLEEYYYYLGWQMCKRRGRDFWSFHRQKLAEVGYPLSATRLAACALYYGLDQLLNPKRTAERVGRRLYELLSRSPRRPEVLTAGNSWTPERMWP